MCIRRPYVALLLILVSSASASWQAQEAPPAHPRALAYSAPLLRGARQAALDVDGAGRMYLAGYICEATLPVTANAAQPNYGGGCDGFIAILAPDGTLQYASYLGGSQQERIWSIDADSAGNVYVGGDSASADFPVTTGAVDTLMAGINDGFVAKLSPGGSLLYATLLGGGDMDFVTSVVGDNTGRAHVGGYTRSTDFPTTAGALDQTYGGRDDAFYTRLEPSGGSASYSTYIAGSGSESVRRIRMDATGAIYLAGTTDSFDLPTFMAFQPSTGGSSEGWLMKIGADRVPKYLTYLGGTGNDSVQDLAVDAASVYVAGNTCSATLPGSPSRPPDCSATFVTQATVAGTQVTRTAFVEDTNGLALAVDGQNHAFVIGSSTSFTTTPDAFQPTAGPLGSATLTMLTFRANQPATIEYATYVGNAGPFATSAHYDGDGGVFIGLQFINDEGHAAFPVVNAPFFSVPAGGAVMHFVPESRMVNDVANEVVMYAEDASAVAGNWRLEADPSAAVGRKLRNPNAGAAKLSAPRAAPADYVEFTFHADAGVDYRLWIRGRADNDNWANDSVFVQFSDSIASSNAAQWRIGTTSATSVNLEDCVNCGVKGWGWQDNGYGANVLGAPVRFATTGSHTLRLQPREDGYSFDQIVLSSARFFTSAPGPLKQASTVLARSSGQVAQAIEEVILHMTNAQPHGAWIKEPNSGAASGTVLRHPDAGGAKVVTMPVPAANYFELSFDAEAGRAYHLWVRGTADRDYWGNDSVHVQFSDSVDAAGTARWRIGTNTSTEVNLEDCSGCGLRAWGWQDNGWGVGVSGPAISFASSGRHVIRVTTREDGFSIDQIVLSAGRYAASSPGALKSDTTILAKTQ